MPARGASSEWIDCDGTVAVRPSDAGLVVRPSTIPGLPLLVAEYELRVCGPPRVHLRSRHLVWAQSTVAEPSPARDEGARGGDGWRPFACASDAHEEVGWRVPGVDPDDGGVIGREKAQESGALVPLRVMPPVEEDEHDTMHTKPKLGSCTTDGIRSAASNWRFGAASGIAASSDASYLERSDAPNFCRSGCSTKRCALGCASRRWRIRP